MENIKFENDNKRRFFDTADASKLKIKRAVLKPIPRPKPEDNK